MAVDREFFLYSLVVQEVVHWIRTANPCRTPVVSRPGFARRPRWSLDHAYKGHAYIGLAYIGHAHIGHAYIGHANIGHAYIGHAYIGHAYIGHAYIGHEAMLI